jgi:hypothetical protein
MAGRGVGVALKKERIVIHCTLEMKNANAEILQRFVLFYLDTVEKWRFLLEKIVASNLLLSEEGSLLHIVPVVKRRGFWHSSPQQQEDCFKCAKQNLSVFGERRNQRNLVFDENNTCILIIEDTFPLHLTYEPYSHCLYMYSPLLDGLPTGQASYQQLCEVLLERAMLGEQMAGGGVGISFTEQLVVMHYALDMKGADADILSRVAPLYIEAVKTWRAICKNIYDNPGLADYTFSRREALCEMTDRCHLENTFPSSLEKGLRTVAVNNWVEEIARFLLLGVDVNAQDTDRGRKTALHHAVEKNRREFVEEPLKFNGSIMTSTATTTSITSCSVEDKRNSMGSSSNGFFVGIKEEIEEEWEQEYTMIESPDMNVAKEALEAYVLNICPEGTAPEKLRFPKKLKYSAAIKLIHNLQVYIDKQGEYKKLSWDESLAAKEGTLYTTLMQNNLYFLCSLKNGNKLAFTEEKTSTLGV